MAAEALADVDSKANKPAGIVDWVYSFRESMTNAIAGDIGGQLSQAFNNPKGETQKAAMSMTTSTPKVAPAPKVGTGPLTKSFGAIGAMINRTEFAMQKWGSRAQAGMVRGKNPFTGLVSIDKSDARKALELNRMQEHAPRSINSLIEADSAEGYRALRANLGKGGDQKKLVKDNAMSNKKTADASTQSVQLLRQIGRYLGKPYSPRSA